MTAANHHAPIPTGALPAADALLVDGRIASIRPLADSDRPAVEALFAASSEQSLYSRFFTLGRRAATEYVSHIFEPINSTSSLIAEMDGEILGLANAEPCGPDEAEVAFMVADRAHGMGMGTLLLEHLAAHSRRSGTRWFIAEVLASNVSMLRVFQDAGFEVDRHMEPGVVRLRMSTTATTYALEAADAREARSERESLRPLLSPRTVAVVGVRRNAGGVGRSILENIRNGGYTGGLFAVHPEAGSIDGFRTYSGFGEIPAQVDLAVVAVPAAHVLPALRDAARAGIRAAVIVSSGFGEMNENGRREQSKLVAFARRHNMRIVGPNCLGIMCNDPALRLNATFGCELPETGGLAVASQSGGVGLAMLGSAKRANMGIVSFVSLGNKADVSGNDLLEAWIDDPGVKVAALYLESFGNPLKFARMARRFSERKPLLAIVGGRSAGGQRAGASHTAAAASPSAAIDALFAQSGVIGCRSLEELVDTARLLVRGAIPSGRRVGIVSNAGGLGVLAADAAAEQGILVPELSPAVRERIMSLVAGTVGISNPIDLGAAISPEALRACAIELLDSDEIDSLIVLIAPTSLQDTASLIEPIERLAAERPDRPVLIVRSGTPQDAHGGGLESPTTYESTERAIKGLSNAQRYGEWRLSSRNTVQGLRDPAPSGAAQLVKDVLESNGNEPAWLTVGQSRELLGLRGIEAPEGEVVTTFQDAEAAASRLGFPITLKTADPTIVHKTDLKLVITGLHTLRDVHDAVEDLRTRAGAKTTPILLQHHIGSGVEIALGLVRDRRFGPLVMVAAGGTATDLLDDRAFLMPPYSNVQALHALQSLRIWPILAGYRGGEAADTAALTSLMEKLGRLGEDVPEVAEIDLNPVIVTPQGIHCVDVKICIGPFDESADAGVPRSLSRFT